MEKEYEVTEPWIYDWRLNTNETIQKSTDLAMRESMQLPPIIDMLDTKFCFPDTTTRSCRNKVLVEGKGNENDDNQ